MKIKMKKNSHTDWKQMVEIMIKNSGNKISSQSFSVYIIQAKTTKKAVYYECELPRGMQLLTYIEKIKYMKFAKLFLDI